MPLLYHWTRDNHARDLRLGGGYHLNQGSPRLHDVDLGDSLWAFTRRADGRYGLSAEIVIRAKTMNPSTFRYGAYRVWGDLERTRYFDLDGGQVADAVIRALSVAPRAAVLGQAFQGHAAVRRLTVADHQLLTAFAASLPLDDRARVFPEERGEAAVLLAQPEALSGLTPDEHPLLAAERREYLYEARAVVRSRALVRDLRERYQGRCQLCAWQPRDRYGADLAEAHHLTWLSRGGADGPDNLALLCPNHHRAVHATDAPFDFSDLAFVFPAHRERLALDDHLRDLRRAS